ncbi:hypothetical protein ACCO45_003316 [Purpureocillium lilacinum]|uniref:Uncharacterized protein n=1 Tax=Purpureocillium lilacinum TaxID=33203 RepID=A0ACC4E2P5_PURLI
MTPAPLPPHRRADLYPPYYDQPDDCNDTGTGTITCTAMNHCLGRSPPNLVGYGEHTYVDQTVVIIPCGRPSRCPSLGTPCDIHWDYWIADCAPKRPVQGEVTLYSHGKPQSRAKQREQGQKSAGQGGR